MPTWEEVQTYARSKYTLAEDREKSFKLIFAYGDKRKQAVVVSCFEAAHHIWVGFTSACCTREQMDPEVALRKNFLLTVGSISLHGDMYFVRHSVPLVTLQLKDFELPLHIVASTADSIELEYAHRDAF